MELLYEIFSEFWSNYLDKKGIVNEKSKRLRFALFIILGMILGVGLIFGLMALIAFAFPGFVDTVIGR